LEVDNIVHIAETRATEGTAKFHGEEAFIDGASEHIKPLASLVFVSGTWDATAISAGASLLPRDVR
jgi:hypothetical protein